MDRWRSPVRGSAWAHGGIACISDGRVVVADVDGSHFSVLSPTGVREKQVSAEAFQIHGIEVALFGGEPGVWLADAGFRLWMNGAKAEKVDGNGGQVLAASLDGVTLMRLDPPSHPAYAAAPYCPTGTAVDDHGTVWVADGYGASLVHRYTVQGRYLGSIDGANGAGRFDCPHGAFIDRRGAEPLLYVADRGHRRVQVFDLDGSFVRSFGEDVLTSPSGFARLGHRLVIAELEARLIVVDEDDKAEAVVGSDERAVQRPGWPNRVRSDGALAEPEPIPDGLLNSPHAIAADNAGHVYVTEFVLGGRVTRFREAAGV